MRFKRSPLVLLFALSLVAACSNSGIDKLHGKWGVDRDALFETARADRSIPSPYDNPILVQFLDTLADEFFLDFDTSKQEIRRKVGREYIVEKYTVISDSGQEITIEVDGEAIVITMTGKDSFSYKNEGVRKGMSMIRVKE